MFIDACEYLGIPYGFYYIDEALNEEEIEEEVEFMQKFIEENSTPMYKLPLVIDLEYQDGKGRTDKIWEQRDEIVNEMIKKCQDVNIDTIVYANYKRASKYLSDMDTKFWIAYYKEDDIIPETWEFYKEELECPERLKKNIIGWQFSENGAKKSGIDKTLDLSLVKNHEIKRNGE